MGRQLKLAQVESEILQYSSSAVFPQPTGSIKYLYLDQSASTLYRWDASTSQYVLLNNPTTPPTSGSSEGELYFADLATSARLAPNIYNNGVDGVGATLIGSSSGVLGQFNQPGKIDNVTPLATDILLLRSETIASRNGLYSITDLGSPTSSYVLTRVAYYDTGSEMYPSQITVLRGSYANQTFVQQTDNPTVGSSSIVFTQSPSTATQILPIMFMDTVTTGPLPAYTYTTGSLAIGQPGYGATLIATVTGSLGVIGGVTASLNARILAVSESNSVYNGSYTVTAPGTSRVGSVAGTPWKLTRIDYWKSMEPRNKEWVISRFGATEYGSRYVLQSSSITTANIGISQSLIFQKYLSPSAGGGITSAFPFTGSALITGSLTVTGSIVTTTGFTGSLQGTASFATSASWAPSISGPFGIANSSGSYTYYTSFSASVAAAPTGSAVEMFADVVETGSVEVILRNNVNIFGNGHTYTLNNSGLIHAIKTTTSSNISCSINNLTVIRRGSAGSINDNAALSLGVSTTGVINCAGSTFINQGSGSGINSQSGIAEINYATAIASTIYGAIGIFTSAGFRLNHSIGYGTAGGFGIRCHNGGNVSNCIGISDSGTGFYGDAGNFSNCTGISVSGPGFYGGGGSGGSAINCTGRSTSGVGFDTTNGINVVNCVGVSVSGVGLTSNITTHNCTGISNSSRGITLTNLAIAYNITAKSTNSYALMGTNTSKIYGGNIISEWNNATGYGIRGNGGNISPVISNCIIRLANSTSPYLFNDGTAASISMKGNTYTGGAPFNPNLTQAITSTQDNQGNIYL